MEISNNRPNYNSVKKGGMIGAAAGALSGAGMYGIVNASTLALKNDTSFSAKRKFITGMSEQYSALGIDMSKITVSKVIAGAKKGLKNPVTIAMGIAGTALIGAGIGFIVDMVKNSAAKKVQKS